MRFACRRLFGRGGVVRRKAVFRRWAYSLLVKPRERPQEMRWSLSCPTLTLLRRHWRENKRLNWRRRIPILRCWSRRGRFFGWTDCGRRTSTQGGGGIVEWRRGDGLAFR